MAKKTENNKQLKYFLITIMVLVLLFLAALFISKQTNKNDKNKYNNFDFQYDEEQKLWFTQVQIGSTPYIIPFYFHPKDLEDIIVEEKVEDLLIVRKPEEVIVTIPNNTTPEIAIAAVEVAKITGERYKILNIPTKSALNERIEGLPFATCADATDKTVIISFEKSKKNIASSKGNCIALEFREGDEIKVADAFAYTLLKIM